jgi:hypothetical protein
MGRVYVSEDGGVEGLFAEGSQGRQEAPWITPDTIYTFRLCSGPDYKQPLATVTVTRGNEVTETVLDVVILLVLIAPIALLSAGAYRALRRIMVSLRLSAP